MLFPKQADLAVSRQLIPVLDDTVCFILFPVPSISQHRDNETHGDFEPLVTGIPEYLPSSRIVIRFVAH